MIVVKGKRKIEFVDILGTGTLSAFLFFLVYGYVATLIDATRDADLTMKTMFDILYITLSFSIGICPIAWLTVFVVKKRSIVIGDDGIVVTIFRSREIRYEDIQKINAAFFVEKKGKEKLIEASGVYIKPKRNLFWYSLGGHHFTEKQLMEIYCALKHSNKIDKSVWKYYPSVRGGKNFDKPWIRNVKYEEVKDHIDGLCQDKTETPEKRQHPPCLEEV